MSRGTPITVRYMNWRGVTRVRRLLPIKVRFGSTAWHNEPQWLLKAVDLADGSVKEYALKDCDFLNSPPYVAPHEHAGHAGDGSGFYQAGCVCGWAGCSCLLTDQSNPCPKCG